MDDVTGVSGPHPDLRAVICDALNSSQEGAPDELRFSAPLTSDQLTIRCQRTWHNITTVNTHLNGGDFSACVVQFTDGDKVHSYFIEAARTKDGGEWRCAGWSGGPRSAKSADRAGGFMLSGGSHVCVGGLAVEDNHGATRVDLADGSTYESPVVDGCAIVFAPVTSPPTPEDKVTVRMLDHTGVELGADTVWIGDGKSPPPRRR